MVKISERLMRLQPSATRTVAERANQLRAEGRDVLSLSTGEPDFVSPEAAMAAAHKALEEGRTFYTPTAGIPELRAEIAEYYRERFDLDYGRDEIMVGAGAKPLLFEAFAALLDPGDEVILTAPAWVSYVEQIRFFDANPVILETDAASLDFDIDAIEAAITPRSRAIVLNAPNNPSGRIYDAEKIGALCRLAIEHDLTILNDEVYERIAFDGVTYRNPVSLYPDARSHVLNINAASKTYAMTGWRIGFAAGPAPLIGRMTMLQGHLTSGPNAIAQWAALGALRGAQADVQAMVETYQARKTLIASRLDKMPRIRYIPPQGAFYIFADIREAIGLMAADTEIGDDLTFCNALLDEADLAIVPGTAFLRPGFVRLSFATSETMIDRAMDRLHRFLVALATA